MQRSQRRRRRRGIFGCIISSIAIIITAGRSSKPQNAIWANSVLGPVFGCGPGILIHENSNMNKDSYSHLGITGGAYKHPEYAENSGEAKSFLAGSERFKVLEIEVYMKN